MIDGECNYYVTHSRGLSLVLCKVIYGQKLFKVVAFINDYQLTHVMKELLIITCLMLWHIHSSNVN